MLYLTGNCCAWLRNIWDASGTRSTELIHAFDSRHSYQLCSLLHLQPSPTFLPHPFSTTLCLHIPMQRLSLLCLILSTSFSVQTPPTGLWPGKWLMSVITSVQTQTQLVLSFPLSQTLRGMISFSPLWSNMRILLSLLIGIVFVHWFQYCKVIVQWPSSHTSSKLQAACSITWIWTIAFTLLPTQTRRSYQGFLKRSEYCVLFNDVNSKVRAMMDLQIDNVVNNERQFWRLETFLGAFIFMITHGKAQYDGMVKSVQRFLSEHTIPVSIPSCALIESPSPPHVSWKITWAATEPTLALPSKALSIPMTPSASSTGASFTDSASMNFIANSSFENIRLLGDFETCRCEQWDGYVIAALFTRKGPV